MPFGLSENKMHKLMPVFEENPQTEEAILFGSRAKGNFRKGSDIDIALKGNKLDFKMLKKLELCVDELMLPLKLTSYFTNQ